MYSFSRTTGAATEPGQRATDPVRDREAFRPVALPALAAAVHIRAASAEAARARAASRRAARMVHEDEPVA